jgi:hypothetical protein
MRLCCFASPATIVAVVAIVAIVAGGCGSSPAQEPGGDAGADDSSVQVLPDGALATDSGSEGGMPGADGGGGPITCPGPGSYKKNGGSCGTERWNIKTGTDSMASGLSLVPKPTTIAELIALTAAGGGNARETPTETTLWELKDVTLAEIKLETDSDYHNVLSDGTHTMIVEFVYPDCAQSSAWSCFISRARADIDARLTPTGSFQYPALTVTVRGFGFFDPIHGQTGVAPNGIELHPVLQMCFGKGCTPS